MCTIAKEVIRITAKTDIPCLKLLQIMEGIKGNPVYVTPYKFKYVPNTVINGKDALAPNRDMEEIIRTGYGYKIENGFIHVYSNKALDRSCLFGDIQALTEYIGHTDSYFIDNMKYESYDIMKRTPRVGKEAKVLGIAVFSAIIPAGTEYIEGNDYDSESIIYAAKQIRLVKKIMTFKDKTSAMELRDKAYMDVFRKYMEFRQQFSSGDGI